MKDISMRVILLIAGFFIMTGCETQMQSTQTGAKGLEEAVKFSVSDRWEIMEQENKADIRRTLFYIPYPPANGTRHSANAFIIIRRCPASMKVRDLDVGAYHKSAPGYIIVNDVMDGDTWRTVLSEMNDEVSYVIMERFGIDRGVSVYFSVTFPMLRDEDVDWHEKIINEFNSVVQSLEFAGNINNNPKTGIQSSKITN